MKYSRQITLNADFSPRGKRKDELLIQTFAKVDCLAFGTATGILSASIIFLTTIVLLLKGGPEIGPNLTLVNQYFLGYSVTFAGSLVGLFYGFGAGFMTGWLVAALRNLAIKIYLHFIKFKGRLAAIGSFLDS